MTDEELAEIEELSRRGRPLSFCRVTNFTVLKLIAEVRRLRAEAETIEVLREWIAGSPINDDFETIDDFERKLIRLQSQGCCVGMDTRVELAKRRIAALEGK